MQEKLKEEVDLVLYENQNVVVSTKEEFSQAGDVLKLVKNKVKSLEDKRKEYTSGLVAQKKAIDDDFKEMQKPLKGLIDKINSVMVEWNVVEQKRLDEEQQKIEDEALEKLKESGESDVDVEVVNGGLKSTKGDIATSTMTQTYTFEVENIAEVPREYLIVDSVKVGKEVRESKGRAKIAGIKNITINKINSR